VLPDEHDLRGLVEQLRVSLGYVETAEAEERWARPPERREHDRRHDQPFHKHPLLKPGGPFRGATTRSARPEGANRSPARFTRRPPRHAMRNAKKATLPHCPGDTQTRSVSSIIATMPTFVGLKMCLPPTRRTNLLAIVTAAAATARSSELVRSSRQSERPEM